MIWCPGAVAAPNQATPNVTVVYRFLGPHSEKSLQEMKTEVAALTKNEGLRIDWQDRDRIPDNATFENLVVVEFRGKCIMQPIPYLYDERGPYAFTRSSGGDILPFSEVECDKIRLSLGKAMWGSDYARSDQLFGRALARVVAHELHHILEHTAGHTHSGVNKRALSGAELISNDLP